jgi:hypothetical protein
MLQVHIPRSFCCSGALFLLPNWAEAPAQRRMAHNRREVLMVVDSTLLLKSLWWIAVMLYGGAFTDLRWRQRCWCNCELFFAFARRSFGESASAAIYLLYLLIEKQHLEKRGSHVSSLWEPARHSLVPAPKCNCWIGNGRSAKANWKSLEPKGD